MRNGKADKQFKSYLKARRKIMEKLDQLDPKLVYHSKSHSLDVLKTCDGFIRREKIGRKSRMNLRLAALAHDIGYLRSSINHEVSGARIASKILNEVNYPAKEIEAVQKLIMATRLNCKPTNKLEQILRDADLDYLGTKKYKKRTSNLYKELQYLKRLKKNHDWVKIQIKFLRSHQYFTEYSKRYRDPVKNEVLNKLLAKSGL